MGKAMITDVKAESCCGDKFFAENITVNYLQVTEQKPEYFFGGIVKNAVGYCISNL